MNTAMKNIFAIATMLAAMCVTTAPEDFVAPFAAIRGSMVDNAPIGDSMETPVSINLRFPSFHQVNVEYPYATSKAKGLQASNDDVKVRGVCHVLVILQEMYDCHRFSIPFRLFQFQFRFQLNTIIPFNRTSGAFDSPVLHYKL